MKRLILICALLLSACASNSPHGNMPWPDTPDDLKVTCPDLKQVDPNTTKLSDALNVITSNYTDYYSCKAKVNNWIEWYNSQQKIFNSIK